MSTSITGHSAVDELPGPDGREPLAGDAAGTGRLADRVFGGAATGAGLLARPELAALARDMWANVKTFIDRSASGESNVLHHHLSGVFVEAGAQLRADSGIRDEINKGVVAVLRSFIADQKSGVSRFIADQVKSWDMKQLINLIEINIGKDLQYIRFNGALIGGLAGLALHTAEMALKAL